MDIDDWFLDSIERYDKLHMFSVCNSIYEQELKSENELYVAFKGERNEVTYITLPDKIMQKDEISPFVTPDLGFSANSIVVTSLIQMKSIYKTPQFILSEDSSVSLYSCSSSESDNDQSIVKVSDISSNQIFQPHMSIDMSRIYLALSGEESDKRLIIDFESTAPVLELPGNYGGIGNLTPLFLSESVILFANTLTGRLELHDIRTGSNPFVISVENGATFKRQNFVEPRWSYCTMFDELNRKITNSNDTRIYAFSNECHFRLYDVRSMTEPLCLADQAISASSLNRSQANYVRLKTNPLNFDQFCVSGLDENLYVFNVNCDNVEMIFKHDGHLFDEECNERNAQTSPILTTSFTWLPQVSDNTVISSSDNCSLQCWQFVAPAPDVDCDKSCA